MAGLRSAPNLQHAPSVSTPSLWHGWYQLCFIAQWIDGAGQAGCSLQASASMGFHVAISLPQELWKATPRLVHIKLPHQPALAQFVWYLLKAEVGAQRWDLFSQVCVRSAAPDNPWFLYASWELDECSVPH